MMRFVVDAQSLLWYVENNPKLSSSAADAVADPTARLPLPVISLAEVLLVIEKGRARLRQADLIEAIQADRRFAVSPLIRADVVAAMGLTDLRSLHDRFIVAFARRVQTFGHFHGLITSDREIRQSQLVPVVW